MRALYLFLPVLSSLAIAQSLIEDDCQCPQVKCPDTNTQAGCLCVNMAERKCREQCPSYVPTKMRVCYLPQQPATVPISTTTIELPLPTVPILSIPVPVLPVPPQPKPNPLALPLPDLPLKPGCKCEEIMCIMSFPQGCHCQWGVKKVCYDKCGGKSPGLNTCPALPVPPPPEPTALDLPMPDLPLVPGCKCEEMMCIQSYPDSCHCAWGIAKDCYDKCGGKSPGINTCPPKSLFGDSYGDGPVRRAAVPEPQKIPVKIPADIPKIVSGVVGAVGTESCDFEERFCVQRWPQSCFCANANRYAHYKKCGGTQPVYQSCTSPIRNPTTIKTTTRPSTTINKPTPTPTTESRRVQTCGGNRANQTPCPTGYKCVDDPYVDQPCGLACDRPGICVKDRLCGGFAGFTCPDARQACLDNPNDDCDPRTGGADCGGLCFWPPALRQKA